MMSCSLTIRCLSGLLFVLTILVNENVSVSGPTHGKVVVCYIGTWAVYRPGRGSFNIEHIDPNLCTHLIYSFAGLNTTHDAIRSLDPWQDLTDNYGKGGYNRMTSLKNRYPHIKVLIAIGGWNEGSINYSNLVADPERRNRFITSAVNFIKMYNFDGLDLDWEFPGKRGGAPQDKVNFLYLVKELHSAFSKHNLLLTAAFGAGKDTIDVAYDVEGLSVYLNYIHMMCYDYHGAWDQRVGSNAPLRGSDVLNVEYSIKYMLKLGAPPEKLVMGIPLYGRTFLLPQSNITSKRKIRLGEAASSTGFQGQFTRENGFMGYNEICLEMKNETLGWSKYWDDDSSTPYAVNGNKVITYDDEKSIALKIRLAMENNLAGAMVWSMDTDDFQGDCGEVPSNEDVAHNYPLMKTINQAIAKSLKEIETDKENIIPHGQAEGQSNSAIKFSSPIVGIVITFVGLLM